jgi:phosphinothricin acetyltransferase
VLHRQRAGIDLLAVILRQPGRESGPELFERAPQPASSPVGLALVRQNATLLTEPVTIADRREWFGRFSGTGPHRLFVARRGSRVLGYAASQPYREHEGFRETVEVSIALDIASRGQGVGTALYRVLLECLAGEPVHVALAGILLPNDASVALHRKLGFTEVGIFHEYAVKNGQHLSSVWMERRFPCRQAS